MRLQRLLGSQAHRSIRIAHRRVVREKNAKSGIHKLSQYGGRALDAARRTRSVVCNDCQFAVCPVIDSRRTQSTLRQAVARPTRGLARLLTQSLSRRRADCRLAAPTTTERLLADNGYEEFAPFVRMESDAKETPIDRGSECAKDDSRNRIARTLEAYGHNRTLASKGSEALVAIGELGYNLMLNDLAMPGMNGILATEEIRHLYAALQIPIMGLTANAFESDRATCIAAGLDALTCDAPCV